MTAAEPSSTSAVEWLLASSEPAIRYLAGRDLLDKESPDDASRVLEGPKVQALLSGQRPDGSFGVHPYQKWTGAHWRLVSLVELAIPAGEPRAVAAAQTVLDWLTADEYRASIPTLEGLTRSHASKEGNALAVACRLGLQEDPRARLLASSLVEWQWGDGGWNCDDRAGVRHSSFHETLPPMWGLREFALATGDAEAAEAARRAAGLLLEHRLFRSSSGEVIHRDWIKLHFPPYWHYEVLQALLILSRMGLAADPRAADALDVVEGRRMKDGRWRPGGYWWSRPGSGTSNVEVVDWGRGGPNEMLTLNALRVLRWAGRLSQ